MMIEIRKEYPSEYHEVENLVERPFGMSIGQVVRNI